MTSRLRALAPWTALGLAAVAGLAWLGLLGFLWTDYEREAAPALAALVRGDVGDFLALCPSYGGSLIIRAPFALAASGLGGGDLAVFRAVAVPCLLAGACLGVVLAAQLAARGRGRAECAVAVLLCAGNPITLRALDIGHPEELLGGALCVGAVLAALRGRSNLAAVLLGLALANKAWALLAVGPCCWRCPPSGSARWPWPARSRAPSCCRSCSRARRPRSPARPRAPGRSSSRGRSGGRWAPPTT